MTSPGYAGLRVASFESRMATEMDAPDRTLWRPRTCGPALREIPLEDNSAALRFGARLLTERIDILILLTGVGTKVLFDILQTRHALGDLIAALKNTALVVRGPKPMAALKTLGLTPTLTVPEPNTWYDLLATLDEYRPVRGLRVAVQEYGVSNTELLDALSQRGADVFPVPVYRWALPEDTGPVKRVLGAIVAGQVDVMVITNAAQLDHVMRLLEEEGTVDQFRAACKKMVVASIGPTASERLHHYDLPVDLEPSHPKMGILVKETSEQVQAILRSKKEKGKG